MQPTEFLPGVPAAGHLAGGAWHPGRIRGCPKCPQTGSRSPRARANATFHTIAEFCGSITTGRALTLRIIEAHDPAQAALLRQIIVDGDPREVAALRAAFDSAEEFLALGCCWADGTPGLAYPLFS